MSKSKRKSMSASTNGLSGDSYMEMPGGVS
jgi:hypothetical protein